MSTWKSVFDPQQNRSKALVYFSQCSEIFKRTLEILYLGIYLNMKWFHETMRDLVTCSPWNYKFAPENQSVGRWCSFWDGLFSGAILVWGRVDQHLLETFFSWTPSLVCVFFSARLVSSWRTWAVWKLVGLEQEDPLFFNGWVAF